MTSLQLQIDDSTVRELYAVNPNYPSDSGFNLAFTEDLDLKAGETHLISFKVKGAMYTGEQGQGYFLIPRSSIYKTPLRQANSIGVIDLSYRGQLMAAVDVKADYTVKRGQSLFQLIHPTLVPFTTTIVDQLDTTDRGDKGFGSTTQ